MKFITTVVSSLVMGVLFASTGFSPLAEVQRLIENKRRIVQALIFAAVGFVFSMAGLLIGLIDAALQYESQGFVFWTALFSLSTGLVCAGVICLILSKILMPTVLPERLNINGFDLSQINIGPLLESWLKQTFESTSQTASANTSPHDKGPPTPTESEVEMAPTQASEFPAGISHYSH